MIISCAGHQGAGRGAASVPPLHRHRAYHSDRVRAGNARHYRGVEQYPLSGVSMRYSFAARRRTNPEEAPSISEMLVRAASGKMAGVPPPFMHH